MAHRILVADDDGKTWATYLEAELDDAGTYSVDFALTPAQCRAAIRNRSYQVVLLDIMYGKGGASGFDLVGEVRAAAPDTQIIMLSSLDDKETMLHSMRLGARYASKTRNSITEIAQQVIEAIKGADNSGESENARRLEAGKRLAEEAGAIFRSPKMLEVFAQAALAREKPSVHVLIRGETGVGKDVVAKAIGREREGFPFVTVNCAGITDTLLHSEFFGHERGSFTGSAGQRIGKFAAAKGGNIFLDELGCLSLNAQAALLRTIQSGEIMRVGAAKAQQIAFRIIAATNADLEGMVSLGTLRADFLARFRRLQINIPPLRERTEDIRPIVENVVASYPGKTDVKFSDDCIHLFESYSWPENVRELRELVLSVLDGVEKKVITPHDLPRRFLDALQQSDSNPSQSSVPPSCLYFPLTKNAGFEEATRSFETFVINAHIASLGERVNKSTLADSLKLPRTTLRRKLSDLNIQMLEDPDAVDHSESPYQG